MTSLPAPPETLSAPIEAAPVIVSLPPLPTRRSVWPVPASSVSLPPAPVSSSLPAWPKIWALTTPAMRPLSSRSPRLSRTRLTVPSGHVAWRGVTAVQPAPAVRLVAESVIRKFVAVFWTSTSLT
jgi:hypothetical protein